MRKAAQHVTARNSILCWLFSLLRIYRLALWKYWSDIPCRKKWADFQLWDIEPLSMVVAFWVRFVTFTWREEGGSQSLWRFNKSCLGSHFLFTGWPSLLWKQLVRLEFLNSLWTTFDGLALAIQILDWNIYMPCTFVSLLSVQDLAIWTPCCWIVLFVKTQDSIVNNKKKPVFFS